MSEIRRKYSPQQKYNKSSKGRKASRRGRLKRRYSISIEQYVGRLAQQNNRCAICRKSQSKLKKSLAVDHNHATGKVRGLLCLKCNRLIGTFEGYQIAGLSTIRILAAIKRYLKRAELLF